MSNYIKLHLLSREENALVCIPNFVGRVCMGTSFCVFRRETRRREHASCYLEDAPRWEKGHRMALSSGSSVSEDVPTLIKMCRASGRVCAARFSLSLSYYFPLLCLFPSAPFPTSSSAKFHSSCAAALYAAYMRAIACDF